MFVYISFTSVYTIESAVFTRPQALHMDTALFPQIPHRHVCSEKHLRREIQEHSLELRRQESVLVWRDRERETVERERERQRQAPWVSFNTLFAFFFANIHILSRKIVGGWDPLSGDSCDDELCPKDAQVGDPYQGVDFFGSCGILLHCAGSLASQCLCQQLEALQCMAKPPSATGRAASTGRKRRTRRRWVV